ncbi:MAG: aminotransferase class IV [Gammaproteobacteria bacterium]|nr:aminotransferase class IV [Gammaproteobacteria bacterium]
MTKRFWVNGEEDAAISPDNRLLRYGDGVFETIRVSKGRVPLAQYHQKRLNEACKRLNLRAFDLAATLNQLGLVETGMLRVAVFAAGSQAGGYARGISSAEFMAWFEPTSFGENPSVALNTVQKDYDRSLAGLKSASALSYVLSSQIGGQLACFVDTTGCIIETQRGNLLFEREGRLYTPNLNGGGVRGVMLAAMKQPLEQRGIDMIEDSIYLEHVCDFDAVWEVNALRGISRVHCIDRLTFPEGQLPLDEIVEDLYRC